MSKSSRDGAKLVGKVSPEQGQATHEAYPNSDHNDLLSVGNMRTTS